METYSISGKTKSYSGFSLAARETNWIQGYREAPKAPVYGNQSAMYDNVKMFKPKYI